MATNLQIVTWINEKILCVIRSWIDDSFCGQLWVYF